MDIASRLDDFGKPAWIFAMVLGFIVFWPIGLGILGYLIWSGRMACWREGGPGRWHNTDDTTDTKERGSSRRGRWCGGRRHRSRSRSSGNTAFDDYREETLRRLQDEQNEFQDFLERLRHAKDKMEFDQFMADRRDRPTPTDDAEPSEDDAPPPKT